MENFSPEADFMIKFGVETGKMIDHFDAEKPILRKTESRTDETAPGLYKHFFFMRVCVLRRSDVSLRPLSVVIPEIPTSYGGISLFIAPTEYRCPRNGAGADNRFSGVGHHSNLLAIQPIRIGVKFNDFPHGLFFGLLAY